MSAQHLRTFVLRAQLGHHPVPKHACCAQFGNFHEEVHADGEKEAQAACELVDIEARRDAIFHIFHAVGDGEGEFLHLRRPSLLHVIAGDRDAVEFGHVRRSVGKNVRDDPHAWFGRVDVGVANHELFEDVVLDGSVELLGRNALLLSCHDEESEDRDHRAVHRHRHRHLVERDAVEQDFHILNAVDRHTRLTDISNNARVVRVIAAVGGKVESHRKALLPGSKVATVKGVRFFSRRKACILANCPRPTCIHRRTHAAGEWRETRQTRIGRHILCRIKRLHGNPFGRVPGQVFAFDLFCGGGLPIRQAVLTHQCTIQAAALGRAETRACQARKEVRSSDMAMPMNPAKSTVVRSNMSATVYSSVAINSRPCRAVSKKRMASSARGRLASPHSALRPGKRAVNGWVCTQTAPTGGIRIISTRRLHISTKACSRGSRPNRGGSGCMPSR